MKGLTIIRYKVNNQTMRDLVLEGKKYNASQAFEDRLIDLFGKISI